MRCRVQNVTRLPNGTTSTKDREITTAGNRVRIGRGTDNDIVLKDLSVAYRHADIVVRDFDIVVEAVAGSAVRFDDVAAGRGVLTAETVVGIGPYEIRLLPPERGFDLALSIETGEAAAAAPPVQAAPLRLRGGLLARRPLSWLLFAAVLAGFLVLPVAAHLGYDREHRPELTDGRAGGKPQPTLLAGYDHSWDTGELSDPHKFLQQRCEACHVGPFTPIRDEDCGTCHGTVRHHFGDPAGTITAALRAGGLEATRCVSCHSEHRGAHGAVPAKQALCVSCHQDLLRFAAKTPLVNATDFGRNHPPFKPSVVVDAAAGTVQRLELGGPVPLKESSGLRFDHACHLGGDKVQQVKDGEPGWLCAKQDGFLPARSYPPRALAEAPSTGELARIEIDAVMAAGFKRDGNRLLAKLECASCHLPDAGGANMRPVSMENHCSYCHSLEFDKDNPERVLPHGKPQEIVDVLTYFYGAEAVRPPLLRTDPATKLRRRPGAKAEPSVAPATAGQAAAAQGPNPAFAKRLERVFADDGASTCGYCHRTTADATHKGVDYDIVPVQVQRIWEPLARFDHAAHTNLPCAHCHEAAASLESSDVLMPPIANCRGCHQGEATAAAVPSTCTMCHVYHQEKATCPMVPGTGIAVLAPVDCPAPAATAASVANN
jgi:predicted CXXCH cytochrome family protein